MGACTVWAIGIGKSASQGFGDMPLGKVVFAWLLKLLLKVPTELLPQLQDGLQATSSSSIIHAWMHYTQNRS
eukprot:4066258-Amphidinium_carterae.1